MDIPRTRDVIVLVTDLSFPVMVTSAMAKAGWVGGTGATWTSSPDDNFLVTFSDGTYGGMLLWGSNETADQFSAYTGNQPTYQFAVLCTGTWVVSTIAYEKYTLASRLAGPLVPNVYQVGQRLTFSNRGLWCPWNGGDGITLDEWTVSGDSRAPNTFFVGSVIQVPNASNNNYLMIQTSI